tara:strand:- start:460 stop:864 length:405 start_codon:yes stop_codon:yes gene_type:complete
MPEYSQDPVGQALMNIPEGTAQDPVDKKISELNSLSSTMEMHKGQVKGMFGAMNQDYLANIDLGDLSGSPESMGVASQVKANLDTLHTDKPEAMQLSKALGQFLKASEAHNKAIPDQSWVDQLTPQQVAKSTAR